ncbi:MAG: alpha/beta hydrolase [Hyphomicrobiaceae bacterium]
MTANYLPMRAKTRQDHFPASAIGVSGRWNKSNRRDPDALLGLIGSTEQYSPGIGLRSSVRTIFVILVVVGGAYAVFVLFLYWVQAELLYFPNAPSRALGPGPDSIGIPYETVNLLTEDGASLHAWYVPAPSPRGVVLFFHGNAGNISHRLESLKIFHDLNLSTFIVDYRGYGLSDGKTTELGTYRDAEAAWHYLTEKRKVVASRIVIFGRSLGAAIAAHLASRRRPAALIVESGFISVPDLASDLFPWIPARLLTRFSYATGNYLRSVSAPVLVIHSRNDEVIPYEHGMSLFAHAPEPKKFLELHGGHNDGFLISGRHYIVGLDAFIASLPKS